jgi:hypothetical protein
MKQYELDHTWGVITSPTGKPLSIDTKQTFWDVVKFVDELNQLLEKSKAKGKKK